MDVREVKSANWHQGYSLSEYMQQSAPGESCTEREKRNKQGHVGVSRPVS